MCRSLLWRCVATVVLAEGERLSIVGSFRAGCRGVGKVVVMRRSDRSTDVALQSRQLLAVTAEGLVLGADPVPVGGLLALLAAWYRLFVPAFSSLLQAHLVRQGCDNRCTSMHIGARQRWRIDGFGEAPSGRKLWRTPLALGSGRSCDRGTTMVGLCGHD